MKDNRNTSKKKTHNITQNEGLKWSVKRECCKSEKSEQKKTNRETKIWSKCDPINRKKLRMAMRRHIVLLAEQWIVDVTNTFLVTKAI